MENRLTELEIIEGLKQGDTRIFNYLFDKYFTSLCYFAISIVSNREEAEDIVIRVFGVFWEKCENFNTEQNVKAFLFISTRNSCFNCSRSNQRRKELEQKYTDLVKAVTEDQFENLHIEAELMRKIYVEIENLPAKCKEVFKLAYFDGLKTNEIACRLNISRSTVRSQKSIASKMLKLALIAKGEILLCLMLIGKI